MCARCLCGEVMRLATRCSLAAYIEDFYFYSEMPDPEYGGTRGHGSKAMTNPRNRFSNVVSNLKTVRASPCVSSSQRSVSTPDRTKHAQHGPFRSRLETPQRLENDYEHSDSRNFTISQIIDPREQCGHEWVARGAALPRPQTRGLSSRPPCSPALPPWKCAARWPCLALRSPRGA